MTYKIFDNLKMVLFDFDGTLAVHENHRTEHNLTYQSRMHQLDRDPWVNSGTNHQLEKFMLLCLHHGVQIGLISATGSSMAAQRRIEWVARNYGVTCKDYCVGHADDKVVELEAIAIANKFSHYQIAIVDDYWKVLTDAADAGFVALSPLQVVNFINEMERSGEEISGGTTV